VPDLSWAEVLLRVALAGALGDVVALDRYGRDYKLSELTGVAGRRSGGPAFASIGGRLANMAGQGEWTSAFFAPKAQAGGYAGFGPRGSAGRSADTRLGFDQSLRAGVDVPMGTSALQLRLTGDTAARSDFAADPALAPLSFFASSELLNRSAMVGFSRPTSETGRLVMFAAASGGTQITPEYHQTFAAQNGYYDPTADRGLQFERTPREQAGFGLGWWKQADERTVIGVNVSSFSQRHAFYDMASDLAAFDGSTQVSNFGVAAMRQFGAWDVFGAAEATSIRAPDGSGPIRFTDATLASAEAGVRRANLFADGRRAQDALSVSLALKPRALSGALQLNYMDRSGEDGALQAVDRSVALSDLTANAVRVQSAYTLRAGERWSFGLAAGADLAEQADASFATQLNWSF